MLKRSRICALALAGIGSMAVEAHASGVLSTSFLNGQATSHMHCTVGNIGTKEVLITAPAIVNAGNSNISDSTNCNNRLLVPGDYCSIDATEGFGRGTVTVKGSTRSIRARCAVMTNSGVNDAEGEMR